MLLKWITCQVHPEMRYAFSKAQEQWRSIEEADGFQGQLGGWDINNDQSHAFILGFWTHRGAYDTFMRQLHDQVTKNNQQDQTYHQISVGLFESHFPIEGQDGDLASAYQNGRFLRVADCHVKPSRIDHFLQVQHSIWIPGMRKAPGMLGGSFNRALHESNRFLVTTVWANKDSHDHYVKEMLPNLRQAAAVTDDLDAIAGRFIKLEDSWLIRPLR